LFNPQDKNERLKSSETKLDDEKNQLRVSLDDVGNQLTRAELLRQSLEGDVQRMRLAVSDKEVENQVLSSRAEDLTIQIRELESKMHALTSTVDRLRMILTMTEQQKSLHKNQVSV